MESLRALLRGLVGLPANRADARFLAQHHPLAKIPDGRQKRSQAGFTLFMLGFTMLTLCIDLELSDAGLTNQPIPWGHLSIWQKIEFPVVVDSRFNAFSVLAAGLAALFLFILSVNLRFSRRIFREMHYQLPPRFPPGPSIIPRLNSRPWPVPDNLRAEYLASGTDCFIVSMSESKTIRYSTAKDDVYLKCDPAQHSATVIWMEIPQKVPPERQARIRRADAARRIAAALRCMGYTARVLANHDNWRIEIETDFLGTLVAKLHSFDASARSETLPANRPAAVETTGEEGQISK